MWDEAKDRSSDVAWGAEKLKAKQVTMTSYSRKSQRNTKKRLASERALDEGILN